jgi:beta-lysine 5,6-aminomutase alpha subunit
VVEFGNFFRPHGYKLPFFTLLRGAAVIWTEVVMVESKLGLDQGIVAASMGTAKRIANAISKQVDNKTTTSIERSILRLAGVDGVGNSGIPLPNQVIDHIIEKGGGAKGIGYWLGNAILHTQKSPQVIAEMISDNGLDIVSLPRSDEARARAVMFDICKESLARIREVRTQRENRREQSKKSSSPFVYVITGTGNVYEDVIHARTIAYNGGDIVAVIRSTAQSLLDYVPYGATAEGYGGTFATQENFRIMRAELDTLGQELGRYIRLSSFCSGLCMPEIAVMGSIEGLDNMVNDALYGVLYRDINSLRTFVDQKLSRMLNGFAGIVINTGEDNYLKTDDAIQAAPTVVASQMINYHLALDAGLPENQIGIGNAFEIDPKMTNSFLFEWANAQLTRELFPNCPTKYMPPTRYMNGNMFTTHACDTLYNLIGIGTRQGIHLVGIPTEGIHTPHLHDKVIGIENTSYVFNAAQDMQDEIVFKPGGLIQTRAQDVLWKASEILRLIENIGLFNAIEQGFFGGVSRKRNEGRGMEGVFLKDKDYYNPVSEIIAGRVI